MASLSGSAPEELSCLNHLIQQRREITTVRDKEDSKRSERQDARDKIFSEVQVFKVAQLEAAEALRLAREQANQEAILVMKKERHEKELTKLQRRHENEVRAHERDTEKMLNEIKDDTDVLVGELLRDLDAEARIRSLEREKDRDEIQKKREREDNLYKELVFRAVEDEARQPFHPPSANLPANPSFSNSKRTHSDYALAAPLKAQTASSKTIPRVLRSSKRLKSENPNSKEASISPSATLSPEEVIDLTGETSEMAEPSGNEHTGRSFRTRFELRFISDNFRHAPTATIWKAMPGQPNRSLRANLKKKTFEPYDGEFCESSQQPTWVLNAIGAGISYDRDNARMQVLGGIGGSVLQLEFRDSKEFGAFMVLFEEHYERFCRYCLPVRSPTGLFEALY